MIDIETKAKIVKLGLAWQDANDLDDALATPVTASLEQKAYDAYMDACDEEEVCAQLGCYEHTEEHVRCSWHRFKESGS